MKITPLEIRKQEFRKSMRGYDTVEVDTFLEMLGKEYEALLNQNSELEKKQIELETELKNYKEVERTLKQTLMNVQESSTKSMENSKKEADLVIREAELDASKLVEEARREKQVLQEEMISLKTQKQSLINRLRHVLTSQLELIEVLEMDDEDISKLKDKTKKVFSAAKIKSAAKGGDKEAAESDESSPEIFNDVFKKNSDTIDLTD